MCGITGGLWWQPQRALAPDALERMIASLEHRGPDDDGRWRREYQPQAGKPPLPGVALGFRRLSIIDIAGGQQPISNEDGTVWMVFNGEIYNHADLRRRLQGSGHQFKSRGDGEAIVHLYEDLGVECFAHLNGMFAVAIWDERNNQLVLARDRLGQKPLYYRHEPQQRALFASELKSLLEAPDVPRELCPTAIDQYLTYQYVPHPRSIYKGVHKLAPGHFAVFNGHGDVETTSYWNPDFSKESDISEADAAATLRELLQSSVELRLQSEAPLGAFLSGGVDSSLIVALMQQASQHPVQTFTISFAEKQYDESRYAQQVAQALGTDHQQFQVSADMLGILPKLVWHYDEPFADSSAIPTWWVSQHTRNHVTVALSGDGGDELFAGYSRYTAVKYGAMFDAIPPVRSMLSWPLWQWLPGKGSMLRQFKRFSAGLNFPPVQRYLNFIEIFSEQRRAELYTDEFLESLPSVDPARFLWEAWRRSGRRDPITHASLADLVTYLPCDLNCKVDIASMAHGLEVRQPMLDHRLVEFAAQLPLKWKHRGRRGKRILRKAFGKMLPRNIWNRKKQGFGVPLDHWFRGQLKPLLMDTLLSDQALDRGIFRREAVQQLIDEHLQQRTNHDKRLWALLFFELWQRRWVDGEPS